MYDIVIIGAGPAGLTAAIYAGRAGKKVLVLESLAYGGQIINTLDINNYPAEPHISGAELAKKLYAQAKEAGAEFVFEKALEIKNNGAGKIVKTEENEFKTKAIIIATGSMNKKLGLENEDELVGKGVSYCATCDGALYKGKIVAVVGGGNSALWEASYLKDIAKKVYLIHHRDKMRGSGEMVKNLEECENVEIIYNSEVKKLNFKKKLESIELLNSDGTTKELKVDGVFVAIGRAPANEEFRNLIKLDSGGYIVAGESCETNVEGIFVAGDNRTKTTRQIVTATADGAVAATAAINFINNL